YEYEYELALGRLLTHGAVMWHTPEMPLGRAHVLATALAGVALTTTALADGPARPTSTAHPALEWKDATSSPRPLAAPRGKLASLQPLCGPRDAALAAGAALSVERQLAGGSLPPSDELAFVLRAAGDPHVWPRAWSISGPALEDGELERRLRAWNDGAAELGV